jgi:hypothetical protein
VGETAKVDRVEQDPHASVAPEDLYDFLVPLLQPDTQVTLGSYRVVGVIGIGGMGIVLKAEDPQLGRQVAIKMLKPALATLSVARQRFLREARASAAVINDHIVPIYHVGEDRGVPYFVMPLLAGETLERRFRSEGRLPLTEVLRIGREIASGLEAAHGQGLVHRDIKPSNIWLDADSGRVRILDFGLARIEEDTHPLSHMGRPIGTPAYMAPEQARGEPVGPRADLFSLGCVFYRLSTGAAPFNCATPHALYRALEFEEPRPLQKIRPDLPPAFTALVHGLLAKNPADRPASAHEVAREITAIEENVGSTGAHPWRSWRAIAAVAVVLLVAALGYAFSPTIYRLATDQGDLVIETNDPGVEVIIKDRVGKVIDRTGKREILLKKGEYEIDCVIADGSSEQRFLTRRVTIRRADRLVVDAHIEKAKLTTERARQFLQAQEARAAQWALSHGAQGRILLRGNREELTSARNEHSGNFHVINLIFGPDAKVSDSDLDYLHEVPSLISLKLQGDWVHDASLAHLESLNNLQRLDLVASRVTDAGMVHVSKLANLDHLVIAGVPITDAGLAELRPLRKLHHFQLSMTRITEAGLDCLSSFPALTGWLTLHNSQVTDQWLPHLTKLSGLTGLGLTHNPISDRGLASLRSFSHLQYLSLSQTKLSDSGLSELQSLTKLVELDLANNKVSDAGLSHLRGLTALRQLDLRKTSVTANGVAELQKAFPQCQILFDTTSPAAK